MADVAKDHRVSVSTVSRTVRRFTDRLGWVRTQLEKRKAKEERKALIAESLRFAIQEGVTISSAQTAVRLASDYGITRVKDWEARMVMRDQLDLRFRHLKPSAPQTNTVRSLALRQQFSFRLINWAQTRPRLINIDETWLNMSDFRRTAWIPKWNPLTKPVKPMSPRISLLVALDNHGELYYALNQGNTNKEVMCLFLRGLATKLNQEGRNWRSNTLIYMDGAPYHDALETIREAKALNLPLALMGPYSYDTAPCELLFAEFKKADINPDQLPTGKK